MARYGMLIELDHCLGCGICVRACKDEFEGNDYPPYSIAQPTADYGWDASGEYGWPKTPRSLSPWVSHGHRWMDLEEEVTGSFPEVGVRYRPTPCMHCQNAPCQEAGENGAVTRGIGGVVLIDPERSVGQRHLVASCPYGRIEWNDRKDVPQKCSFCAHLLETGGQPRCVEACPVGAITAGDLEAPGSQLSLKINARRARPFHPEYGTAPAVFYAGVDGVNDDSAPGDDSI